jgi:DNA-directed RNA polymerase specialized sigma subunit
VNGTKNLDAPFTKWIHKAIEKELQIADRKKQLQLVKCETISVIDKLANIEHKILLIYRYIDRMSWYDIASTLYVSLSTIKRWHKCAIISLKIDECIV